MLRATKAKISKSLSGVAVTRFLVCLGAAMVAVAALSPPAMGVSPPVGPLPEAGAVAPATAAPLGGSGLVAGPIRASDGFFLRDQYGRAVILHGVNAVYKRAPYVLYNDPGQPNDFTSADASQMASLGFNVVRLGILWEGLEPGTDPADDPAVCTPGKPGDPGQLDMQVLMSYLAKVKQPVDLLGSYHIYTLLDMHQDLYSSVFGGEGAPPWAVCTDGLPTAMRPGRWSHTYASPALDAAFEHFWNNDVIGDLQGEYDRTWGIVASFFRNDPWILGYDLMNEPFSRSFLMAGHQELDTHIECFYTGRSYPGVEEITGMAVTCPPDDPAEGLIPTIEANDPTHLIFFEPDIFTREGGTNFIGTMNFPRLVFNFHSYCPFRNPVTGDPVDAEACADHVLSTVAKRLTDRGDLGSPSQPEGPGAFMSEFGATGNAQFLQDVTTGTLGDFLSWTYWQWKFYDDPTGSSDEALVDPGGQLKSTARALEQTYAQAIAGTPISSSFDAATAAYTLTFAPDSRITAPTVIFVPSDAYPSGYCARSVGAAVISAPDASHLELVNLGNAPTAKVSVTVTRCSAPAVASPPNPA